MLSLHQLVLVFIQNTVFGKASSLLVVSYLLL